jgi:hypothetical protein
MDMRRTLGLVALEALLTLGLLHSLAWLCKQLWEQAAILM